MSTITDELIETQLPDKTSGKYKPKRLRVLLKALTEQILSEATGKNIQRINFSISLGPDNPSTFVSQIAGFDVFVKKVVLSINNYDGTSIPEGENIKIAFGGTSLYDGPVLPEMSIPGTMYINFTEMQSVSALFKVSGSIAYSFQGAIFIEEL